MAAITNVLARIAGRSLFPGRSANLSLHTRLAARVVEDLSRHLQRSCHLDDIHLTRTGSLIVRVHADRSYVAKLPLYATTEPRLRRSADALKTLAQAEWITPFLAGRCPAIVLTGKASGFFYSIETAVPGQDGASILKTGGTADEMILSAERFLSKLQKASGNRQSHGWQEHFGRAVTRVSGLAARAGVERAYTTLIADLRTRLSLRPPRAVYSHGNFWLGNVLFDTANQLTGVIDWDSADTCTLPALDLIYLVVRTHGLARSTSVGEGFTDWIAAESLPFLDQCVSRHFHELSIPTELVVPLAYCSWIQHLDAHCQFGTPASRKRQWLEKNVRVPLEHWERSPGPNVQRWQRER
ncbi:MAG TPA: aminoglycoside phosphotransferase family protein [Vicinamibacterales bacterium]|nr:aminoglycoside phosphotransferase family protein [Vicinamibacterales bacterium]